MIRTWLPSAETQQALLAVLAFLLVSLPVTGLVYFLRGRSGAARLPEADHPHRLRIMIFRVLAVGALALGLYYLPWRYTSSMNTHALWFAIPLVLAETYSFLDLLLFILMMWKPPRRIPPDPIPQASVDVFITTYNEPPELLRLTAEAALRIDWPRLKVYVLDDGQRPEIRAMAAQIGCRYLTRGGEWTGKPRHAKAGNINSALMQTRSEFILILDADQIPAPQIIRRTIGYFRDPRLAFVQTPQYFYNLPPGDPFGSDAPLFYGPIMQGKDGWDAAFFCGSNAILRREALLQLGLTDYVRKMEDNFREGLKALEQDLTLNQLQHVSQAAARVLLETMRSARQALKRGETLERVSDLVRRGVSAARQAGSRHDLDEIAQALSDMAAGNFPEASHVREYILSHEDELSQQTALDARSLGLSETALEDLSLTRSAEAQPILPLATISITEDMATAIRLHALGWKSLFHPEILAYGLAPEDLGSALNQRLRWAQGTLQVFLHENPLSIKGLSLPQRIQYFTTIYSYFSGFSSLIYLLSPIIYLFSGIAPVSAWSAEFLWRLIPFLLMNRILFYYIAQGISVFRGEQYSLALFPLWIQAVVSVFTGRRLKFVVTPKQQRGGTYFRLIWPQFLVILLTAFSILFGIAALSRGWVDYQAGGVAINIFWGCYNIVMLWTIVRAAVYRPPAGWEARPPAFLLPPNSA